jgi:type IV pilus biogenesis protein PilP
MKIVANWKRSLASLLLVGTATMALSPLAHHALAQDPTALPVLPDMVQPAAEQPATTPAPAQQGINLDAPPSPATPSVVEKQLSHEGAKKQASDQIDEVLKNLQSDSTSASLEDMNQARAALAKLDLLVSIEQKMSDLDEVRRKRGELASFSDMIPASAIGGHGGNSGGDFGFAPPPAPVASYDVSRIVGTDGNYSAVVSVGGGRMLNVRVGDNLPDGSEVRAITASGVRIKTSGGKEKTLRVSASAMPATLMKGQP